MIARFPLFVYQFIYNGKEKSGKMNLKQKFKILKLRNHNAKEKKKLHLHFYHQLSTTYHQPILPDAQLTLAHILVVPSMRVPIRMKNI